jgi:hypothetical protein
MLRVVLALAPTLLLWSCGGSDRSPIAPDPPATAGIRAIHLEGPITFGDVTMGQSGNQELRITNRGTAALTVTGVILPAAGVFSSSFAGATVPAGATIAVPVRFTPAAERTYRGAVTVQADHTSGINTVQIAGRGLSTTPVPPGQRVFGFDSSPHPWPVAPYTEESRYVLFDNGTFALQFPGAEYRGRYSEADGRITFEWDASGPGPYQWMATGVLSGDGLTVTYNTWMGWADFENGLYIRIP